MLSISTAYSTFNKRSWEKLLRQTRDLGFDCLELNVEIPAAWMDDIRRSVDAGEIKISSLHNYCPAIEKLPSGRTIYSGLLLTSDDDTERKLALDYTRRTMEHAARLGAKAVVLHAGEVVTDPTGREFSRYIHQFGRNGKLYDHYFESIRADRSRKADIFMTRLLRAFDELVPFAQQCGLVLGIENRFHFHEIPDISEAGMILDRFRGGPVGYWHDTGHAEIFVRMGWVGKHADFLEPHRGRIVGMHLHDIKGMSDHHAPGSGEFDFSILSTFVTAQTLLVIEAHAKASGRELEAMRSHLDSAGLLHK